MQQLRHVGTTPDGVDLWACVVCQRPSTRDKAPGGRRHHPGHPRIQGHGMCGKCWVAAKRRKGGVRMRGQRPAPPTLADYDRLRTGACVGHPWGEFTDTTTTDPWPYRERAALRWCAHCPIRAACADYADRHHLDGLWAGTWRNVTNHATHHYTLTPLIDDAAPHHCQQARCIVTTKTLDRT